MAKNITAKVTENIKVTLPKSLARQYEHARDFDARKGDEISLPSAIFAWLENDPRYSGAFEKTSKKKSKDE